MKLLVKKIDGLPENTLKRAYEKDAALDVVAVSEPIIIGECIEIFGGTKVYSRIKYLEYKTNLFLSPQPENEIDYHIEIYPRSSISNMNLVLANSVGVADAGFTNEYVCRFKYIPQGEDFVIIQEEGFNKVYININKDLIYKQFDRIAQIKPSPNIPVEIEYVSELPKTQRGERGLGSTGN